MRDKVLQRISSTLSGLHVFVHLIPSILDMVKWRSRPSCLWEIGCGLVSNPFSDFTYKFTQYWSCVAIWFMPRYNAYGTWPNSGEIDLMESRGNKQLIKEGVNIGTEQVGQTLHFGPYWNLNGYDYSSYVVNNAAGYDNDYHLYQLEWTPEHLRFKIDDKETGTIKGPFWELGKFDERAPGTENPWRTAKTTQAPFDQEFYLIMNLAVGGTNGYFPDDAQGPYGKPWSNQSPVAFTEFWNNRGAWLPSWALETDFSKKASLKVDYVKIWAL